jgi:hypothetical protein
MVNSNRAAEPQLYGIFKFSHHDNSNKDYYSRMLSRLPLPIRTFSLQPFSIAVKEE